MSLTQIQPHLEVQKMQGINHSQLSALRKTSEA